MKKYLLLLLLVAGVSQLKAQQLSLKPTDTMLFKAPKNFNGLKWDDSNLLKDLAKLPKTEQLAAISNRNSINANTVIFYSRMPVAKLNSNDRMPVAKPDNINIDRMPVEKVIIVDPLAKLKQPMP